MGDYIPVFDEGDDLTMTAGAAITGGQLVYVSADNTVQKTAGATAAWLGVALFDAASGAKVTVCSEGVQELAVAAAVNAGDLLVAAANGQVTPLAAVTTPTAGDVTGTRQIVGIALTGQSTVGQTCRVRLAR